MSKETEKKIADLEEKLKRISSTGGVTLTRDCCSTVEARDRRDVGH